MISTLRIEERMAEMGLNPFSTAKKAGLGPDYVRDLLRGKVKQPSAAKLNALAIALDCSPSYLMGLEDAKGDAPFEFSNQTRSANLSVEYLVRPGFFESREQLRPKIHQSHWVVSTKLDGDEWLEEVTEDLWDGYFRKGDLVHVVPPVEDYLNFTKLAVVETWRHEGSLLGRSIERLGGESPYLRIEGRVPTRKWTLEQLVAGEDQEYGQVVGLVIRLYRFFDGGRTIEQHPF